MPDLEPEDQAGLHAVISDPTLRSNANALQLAVNGFLGRAVQAELYCGFNTCQTGNQLVAAGGGAIETR